MTCTHCAATATSKRQLERECKFWKDRYFVEKKCRGSLIQWILGVFGYSVRVDVDKETLGIRIEGRENNNMMANAVVQSSSDNKITLMMEDRVNPEDLLEEAEELTSLALFLGSTELDPGTVFHAAETHTVQIQEGSVTTPLPVPSTVPPSSVAVAQPLEVSGVEGTESVIMDLFRSFDDSGVGQQQSYIILKDGEGEGIPVQIDCSQFINGGLSTTGSAIVIPQDGQQILYRLASPTGVLGSSITNNSGFQEVVAVTGTGSQQTLMLAPKKSTTTQTVVLEGNVQLSTAAGLPPLKKAKIVTAANTCATLSLSETKSDDKGSSTEFGLTLREKAEAYVHAKSVNAIRKTTQGSYTCIACSNGYTFSTVDNALIHTHSHFADKPYKCNNCEESFAIQKDFLNHRRVHHSKKPPSNPVLTNPVFSSPKPAKILTSSASSISEPISSTVTTEPKTQLCGEPGPANRNKQFKCTISGCDWSYGNATELGWHLKAHAQSRV